MALSQSLSSEHGKMEREECAGETLSALMALQSLLCVLSERSSVYIMTQALCIYMK